MNKKMESKLKKLNSMVWICIKKIRKAHESECFIEEVVLLNYLIRYKLLILIVGRLKSEKKIFKETYLAQDTAQLAHTALELEIISKDLRNRLRNSYENFRSVLVHELLQTDIDQIKIGDELVNMKKLVMEVQDLTIGKLKFGEQEQIPSA